MQYSDTLSEAEDNFEILLPIASMLPPNQLISKLYTPDIKPSFKFMPQERKEKRKISSPIETRLSYANLFNQCDTLGYEYSRMLKENLLYLKMNNTQFMGLGEKDERVNYLGGIFIPLEKLLKQEVKQLRNVFKTLPKLQCIDNKPHQFESFAENCFSRAPTVRFSSNYESGNLFAALKNGDEYDLVLQNDVNSKGNNQWFHFTVELPERQNYKFNIVNLTKSGSLYQKGMNIVLLSAENRKIGWQRGGHTIIYTQSPVNRQGSSSLTYYQLHFEYFNPHKADVITFAYCYPYSQIDMELFFNKIMFKKISHCLRMQKIKIGETLSGLPLFSFCITPKRRQSMKVLSSYQIEEKATSSRSVVFLARQHPGESQGSFVLEGVVQYLVENNDFESYKRNYVFYIIPMINMDGIFYGNYRTNLSGNDLNRVWRNPKKDYHSEVISIKKSLVALNRVAPIALIIDIHGHSNSLNSFFYGNPPKKDLPGQIYENPKLFPYFCSRKVKQISFQQSTFSVSEDKKNCARVVLSDMFPKALVYTFENSFFGWTRGKSIIEHTIDSFRRLGRDLVSCYLEYSRLNEKNASIKEKWMGEIEELYSNCKNNHEIASESDTEIDNELINLLPMDESPEVSPSKIFIPLRLKDEAIKYQSSKRQLTSNGKNRIYRHLKNNYHKTQESFHPYIVQDKHNDSSNEAQGFLSITKINARVNYQGSQLDQMKAKDILKSKEERRSFKEAISEKIKKDSQENNVKVGMLINEKQITLERLRQKRLRLEDALQSRNYHSFIKTIVYFDRKKSKN